MKLFDMITSHISNMTLKARLNQEIKLDNGVVLPEGTVSELLVLKHDGRYHFEANNAACTVDKSEITFL